MSDGDAFTRRAAVRWRPLAEAIRDRLSVAECAERLEGCITRDLRQTGGLESVHSRDLLSALGSSKSEHDIEQLLRELARRQCFDRVVPLLIGEGSRFKDYRQAEAFIQMCLSAARIPIIARSLVRRPDAATLSRPRRPRAAQSDMLHENAPLGGSA